MQQFEFTSYAGHVVFGPGSARGPVLRDAADALGARRIMVLAAEAEADLARGLAAGLGERVVATFAAVRPHVPVAVAEAAGELARGHDADCLLSIGGGSTTGTAKAIALGQRLPIIAVPTTYAGSEMTPVWGLTDGDGKRTGVNPVVVPRTVVYDPLLTLSLPIELTVTSGLNALAHCVEALWSPRRNPITSMHAEHGIRSLAQALRVLCGAPADEPARADALCGAWLAGMAFAATGSGPHHKICHVLGGTYDLPHAATHAALLPYSAELACRRRPAAGARIAAALGRTEPVDVALWELTHELGADRSLAELGLPPEMLDDATERIGAGLATLPDAIAPEEIAAMLANVYAGRRPSHVLAAT